MLLLGVGYRVASLLTPFALQEQDELVRSTQWRVNWESKASSPKSLMVALLPLLSPIYDPVMLCCTMLLRERERGSASSRSKKRILHVSVAKQKVQSWRSHSFYVLVHNVFFFHYVLGSKDAHLTDYHKVALWQENPGGAAHPYHDSHFWSPPQLAFASLRGSSPTLQTCG